MIGLGGRDGLERNGDIVRVDEQVSNMGNVMNE
jgi:hypothetical protein